VGAPGLDFETWGRTTLNAQDIAVNRLAILVRFCLPPVWFDLKESLSVLEQAIHCRRYRLPTI
jgi:hypothetical protein